MASLRNVTSETLRYYDRIGLIKPDYVDPETHYRYYSIRQYERLDTIRELASLGMPIKEIKEYFDGRNLEKSKRMLKERQAILMDKVEQKILLSRAVARKLHFLDDVERISPTTDIPFKCGFPKRFVITYGELAGGPREHAFAFTKLEKLLTTVSPVLASDRIGVYCDEHLLHPSKDYIPCVPMIFVEDEEIESEYLRKVPAGDYVCML